MERRERQEQGRSEKTHRSLCWAQSEQGKSAVRGDPRSARAWFRFYPQWSGKLLKDFKRGDSMSWVMPSKSPRLLNTECCEGGSERSRNTPISGVVCYFNPLWEVSWFYFCFSLKYFVSWFFIAFIAVYTWSAQQTEYFLPPLFRVVAEKWNGR